MGSAESEQWAAAIRDYAAWLSIGASKATVRLRRYQLGRLADRCAETSPWDVDTQTLVNFLTEHDWRPETRKSNRAAVVGFYRWARDNGHLDADPAAPLPKVRVRPGKPRPAPDEVIRDALRAGDERERLMVLLAATCGLRRAEIARAHSRDLIGDILTVRGKGDRSRIIPISPCLATRIRVAGRGYLFPGEQHGHISPGQVGRILARLLGDDWTAHTLRHRFATTAFDATRDLRAVQELLGHSKPETTAIYTLVASEALRAAARAAQLDVA